jgi:hypothetical protein
MALAVTPSRPIDMLNAAILYEPVLERLREADKDEFLQEWTDFDSPLDVENPKLRDYLADYQRELALLHRAVRRSHCYFEREYPAGREFDFESSFPFSWCGPLRQAARLLAVDVRVKLVDGDLTGAAANTAAVFQIARHTAQETSQVHIAASMYMDYLGVRCLQQVLNHPELSKDVLDRLWLDGDMNYQRKLRRAFVLDEAFAIALVKQAADTGLGAIVEEEPDALEKMLFPLYVVFFLERDAEGLRTVYRDQRAALGLPYPEARNQLRAINDEENLRKHGLLAMLLVPALDQLAAAVTVGDARHRVARLAIALRAYELEHGKLPETLDGLATEYIDQIPLDPFTDGPMRMEQVDESVRLYSPGAKPPAVEKTQRVEVFLDVRQ